MGDVRDEPLLHLGQLGELADLVLDAVRHPVEGHAQAGHLVLTVDRHPHGQVAAREGLGRPGRLLHGQGHTPRDPPRDQHVDHQEADAEHQQHPEHRVERALDVREVVDEVEPVGGTRGQHHLGAEHEAGPGAAAGVRQRHARVVHARPGGDRVLQLLGDHRGIEPGGGDRPHVRGLGVRQRGEVVAAADRRAGVAFEGAQGLGHQHVRALRVRGGGLRERLAHLAQATACLGLDLLVAGLEEGLGDLLREERGDHEAREDREQGREHRRAQPQGPTPPAAQRTPRGAGDPRPWAAGGGLDRLGTGLGRRGRAHIRAGHGHALSPGRPCTRRRGRSARRTGSRDPARPWSAGAGRGRSRAGCRPGAGSPRPPPGASRE